MAESRLLVKGNRLYFSGREFSCAIGKGGFSANKKEGDGATPLGIFPLRECWYRADRIAKPDTKLSLKLINPDSGWCDDPKSPDYNKPVTLPFAASHECLWREDHAYDVIVPIGYNDNPVVAGKGSAIFIHVNHDDNRPTAGCVSLAKNDLLGLLPQLQPDTLIEIKEK